MSLKVRNSNLIYQDSVFTGQHKVSSFLYVRDLLPLQQTDSIVTKVHINTFCPQSRITFCYPCVCSFFLLFCHIHCRSSSVSVILVSALRKSITFDRCHINTHKTTLCVFHSIFTFFIFIFVLSNYFLVFIDYP